MEEIESDLSWSDKAMGVLCSLPPSAFCQVLSLQMYIQNLLHPDAIALLGEPCILSLFLVADQILLHLLVAIAMNYGLSPPQSYYHRNKVRLPVSLNLHFQSAHALIMTGAIRRADKSRTNTLLSITSLSLSLP